MWSKSGVINRTLTPRNFERLLLHVDLIEELREPVVVFNPDFREQILRRLEVALLNQRHVLRQLKRDQVADEVELFVDHVDPVLVLDVPYQKPGVKLGSITFSCRCGKT